MGWQEWPGRFVIEVRDSRINPTQRNASLPTTARITWAMGMMPELVQKVLNRASSEHHLAGKLCAGAPATLWHCRSRGSKH